MVETRKYSLCKPTGLQTKTIFVCEKCGRELFDEDTADELSGGHYHKVFSESKLLTCDGVFVPVVYYRKDENNPQNWKDTCFRTTKCFGVNGHSICKGSFPKGFLEWIKQMGWIGKERCYLCSGLVDDSEAFTIDVRAEVNPKLVADASNTGLPSESFDWIMIDPPYTEALAKEYYGTDKDYHGINSFTKEAERLCRAGWLILTLTYEIPKRIPNCEFIAIVGVYTVPFTGYMRCFTVSKKLSVVPLSPDDNTKVCERVDEHICNKFHKKVK